MLPFGQQLAARPASPRADTERAQSFLRDLLFRPGTDRACGLCRDRKDLLCASAIRFSAGRPQVDSCPEGIESEVEFLRFVAALLLACSVCTPVCAQTAVDLQLVLAVDASGSVDQRRFELQMQGYVAAFRDPRVLRAIQSGATQAIAVTLVQWTGPAPEVHRTIRAWSAPGRPLNVGPLCP